MVVFVLVMLEGPVMSDHIGFYYPETVFKDDWIKLAALYWDKIARIEWEKGPEPDSETVRQLAGEVGFIINLTPSSEEVSLVSEGFIETISKHKDVLQQHYGLSRIMKIRNPGTPIPMVRTDVISEDFMTLKMLDFLESSDLGRKIFSFGKLYNPKRIQHIRDEEDLVLIEPILLEEWQKRNDVGKILHHDLYFLYMRSLAEKMAFNNRMHLLTDKVFDHVASSGYSIERLIQASLPSDSSLPQLIDSMPTTDELEFQMATLALRSVVPKSISCIPTK